MGRRGATTAKRERMELLRDADRPDSWMLLVDGIPQSHVDLADPTYLDFEYVRRLGHVVDLVAPERAPIDAYHLGAGALTLARYVAATRPRSRQRAVDIDPDLVALVRQQLPWDRRADLRVATGDARAWLAARRAASADLVICDVFVGARTPAHLTSVEFAAEAARVVRLSGMYAVNVSDGRRLRYTRSQVATVAQVFQHVALVAEPGVLRGRRFGNLVLVAGHEALPVDELARRAHRDPAMARVLAGDELRRWAAGAAVVHDAEAQDSPAPPESLF